MTETGEERERRSSQPINPQVVGRGVAERFIDHLRTHSVRADEVVERHEGEMGGRERRRGGSQYE